MKKYPVSKETFNYITSILTDNPSQIFYDYREWLDANDVGSASYSAIKELARFDKNPSIVITELLQGKAELELIQEKKYRVYHQQPTHDKLLLSYHFFDENYDLNEDDFFASIPIFTQEQVSNIAYIEGSWVWAWAHEVK